MKKQLLNIIQSAIFKNLSFLVSGTVIAQLIIVAFQLFLRRVFTPDDFGAFAVYMSVVGIIVSIGSFRYEQTILLPKLDADGWQLTRLSILISVFVALVFAACVFPFRYAFAQLIGLSDKYIVWLFFLPLTILFFNISLALNYYLMRINMFKTSGENKVLRRGSEGGLQIILGFLRKPVGLVFGDLLGQAVVIIRTFVKIKKQELDKEQITPIKQLAIRYKEFPISNGLPSLLNAISRLLPVILISRFFSTEITGYFDLARVILIIPLSLVTVSLNQVLVKQFAEKRNRNLSVKKEAFGVFNMLLLGAIVFALVIKLFSTQIFSFVFGQEWFSSGVYAEVLIWAFALKFIVSPFNACFTAFEKIRIGSLWQVFYFVSILILFFIPYSNIIHFLKIYMLIEVIAFAIAGIINFSILRQYELSLTKAPE